MKTVIILIDQLYLHGGIEKLVAIKANYWTENFGYKVVIVSTEQLQIKPIYNLSNKVEFIDLNINYSRSISFFHPKNIKKLYCNIRELKKVFNLKKPDFILVASHIPLTYVLPYLKTDAKIIKEFHYSKFNVGRNIKKSLFSIIEKKYDYLVVLSEEEKSFYDSNNVKIIPNPVTIIPQFRQDIDEKENVAGTILRFAPVKQLEKMIDIWEIFSQQNEEWKLFIYGDTNNDYFEKINNLVNEKNLRTSVVFKGQTNNVVEAFSEIKILLMTSRTECFPLIILEANSCGVPVISFDSPTGPRNIIHHNLDGIIIPLNDIHTFAFELDQLSHNLDKQRSLSEAAVQNSDFYQIDNIMKLWQKEIFENND